MVPYSLFAHSSDEVLDSRLGKVLVIIFNEFRVDSGNCHKYIYHGGLRTDQLLPNLKHSKPNKKNQHLRLSTEGVTEQLYINITENKFA